MMKRIPTLVRVVVCLVCLTISGLLIASTFGIIPDYRNIAMAARADLCESIAINFSLHVMRGDVQTMEASLKAIQSRNPEIMSLGVRRVSGELLLEIGDHKSLWVIPENGKSTDTHMIVPIAKATQEWGNVEVTFKPLRSPGLRGLWEEPLVRLILFMTVSGSIGYSIFLLRILRQLNPSKVVPNRVRTALDTLAEGLLILDDKLRIVLANDAFCTTVGRQPESLVGRYVKELAWRNHDDLSTTELTRIPWVEAFNTSTSRTGILLDLMITDDLRRTFVVNAAPVFSDRNRCQGVLVSLEDVTPLEQKKKELHRAFDELRVKSEEIRQQNEELERLATTDPLTECMNRRSFFVQFESLWKTSERHEYPISCIMVDIDFFKSINDTHGHAMGDEVLRGVASTLRQAARVGDLVCRFGGEEFCVLLPHSGIDDAYLAGERFRKALAAVKFPNLSITASLGVSSRSLGSRDPQSMLEEADKCLYVAKRNGRNQVVRYDNVPKDLVVDETKISRTSPQVAAPRKEDTPTIPYRAVTALLSTLAFRHRPTAEHCRRVADLCVMLAETRMPLKECYLIETAALLHDIGKIGVPDSILLKTTMLTREEWDVLRRHSSIGTEIIHTSFANDILSSVIENHRAFFGGTPHAPNLPVGTDIPLGARILALADAYDSMTNDSVYRKALSREAAFTELRACAGVQFDPALVEQFIGLMLARSGNSARVDLNVNRDVALAIGNQIERLIDAIDDQDLEKLGTLAGRLKSTAEVGGSPEIAEAATRLCGTLDGKDELLDVLQTANQLVDLCRSTQRAFLDEGKPVASVRPSASRK